MCWKYFTNTISIARPPLSGCVQLCQILRYMWQRNIKPYCPHDDVIKWKTVSALLALFEVNSPVSGEFLSQSQRRKALMFSLICAWTNGWANQPEAGDMRCHRAHYYITVIHTTTMMNFWTLVRLWPVNVYPHTTCMGDLWGTYRSRLKNKGLRHIRCVFQEHRAWCRHFRHNFHKYIWNKAKIVFGIRMCYSLLVENFVMQIACLMLKETIYKAAIFMLVVRNIMSSSSMSP